MKSNTYKINSKENNIKSILSESEKIAAYNELNNKQTMQLRLLCEELIGMLPELVRNFTGEFWIEFEKGICNIKVSIEIENLSFEGKEQLIDISQNKKNAATKGFVGKLRNAIEGLFSNKDFDGVYAMPVYGMDAAPIQYTSATYSQCWSLNQYKEASNESNKAEAWDELEKSVIASVADDVIVGIKGDYADIVVVKNFN